MNLTAQPLVDITFHNLDHSAAVEDLIREKIQKLEKFYSPITSCRVVVEAAHHRHQQGNHFRIRIDLKVRGHELVVGREPDENKTHADVYIAIRDAFNSMNRQLKELVDKQRD